MSIIGIDHVQLGMPPGREDSAREFYAGLLGLMEIPKPAELAKRGGVWFQLGSAQIHLGVDADFRPAVVAHPALLVDDLDDLIARAVAAGFTLAPAQPPLDGYRRQHIFDPFGNRVEFMQRTSPSSSTRTAPSAPQSG